MSEVFRVCGCETLNELCLPCRRRLAWLLVDLEFRFHNLEEARVASFGGKDVPGAAIDFWRRCPCFACAA